MSIASQINGKSYNYSFQKGVAEKLRIKNKSTSWFISYQLISFEEDNDPNQFIRLLNQLFESTEPIDLGIPTVLFKEFT